MSEQKGFKTTLKGTTLTFWYRGIPWTAQDFRVGEKVFVDLDGVGYDGEVKAIPSYGVEVVLEVLKKRG